MLFLSEKSEYFEYCSKVVTMLHGYTVILLATFTTNYYAHSAQLYAAVPV